MQFIQRTRPAHLDCWPNHAACGHRDYIGRAVTLQGAPAKVVKDCDGRAHISPLNPDVGTVPYSWVAVFNIVDNHGGKFD